MGLLQPAVLSWGRVHAHSHSVPRTNAQLSPRRWVKRHIVSLHWGGSPWRIEQRLATTRLGQSRETFWATEEGRACRVQLVFENEIRLDMDLASFSVSEQLQGVGMTHSMLWFVGSYVGKLSRNVRFEVEVLIVAVLIQLRRIHSEIIGPRPWLCCNVHSLEATARNTANKTGRIWTLQNVADEIVLKGLASVVVARRRCTMKRQGKKFRQFWQKEGIMGTTEGTLRPVLSLRKSRLLKSWLASESSNFAKKDILDVLSFWPEGALLTIL